jgi:hypothetical protein
VIDTTLNGTAALPSINFNVYPNPADNQLNISLDQNKTDLQIEVLNVKGQLIMHLSEKQSVGLRSLDISSLTKGVYFLKITSNGHYGVRPFVVVDSDN